MARKIISGIGSVLGIKKKKADPATSTPAEQKGPIITPLGSIGATTMRRRLVSGQPVPRLSEKLGTALLSDKLGG